MKYDILYQVTSISSRTWYEETLTEVLTWHINIRLFKHMFWVGEFGKGFLYAENELYNDIHIYIQLYIYIHTCRSDKNVLYLRRFSGVGVGVGCGRQNCGDSFSGFSLCILRSQNYILSTLYICITKQLEERKISHIRGHLNFYTP